MKLFKYLKSFFTFILKEIFASFIFLAVLLGIILIFAITLYKKNDAQTTIGQNSYIILSLPDGLKEDVDFNLNILDNGHNLTMFDVLNIINYSRNDEKISGIILDLDNLNLSFSQIEELEKALKNFKLKGKTILGYAYNFNKSNYLLGSIANKLSMDPSASTDFSLEGFKISVPYSKSLTDKIGIEFQIIHVGDYKTFGENYVKNSISEESKISYKKILNSRMNYFTETVSNNKNLNTDKFKKDFLNGKYILLNSKKALENKFIDNQITYDNFFDSRGVNNTIDLGEYYTSILKEDKKNKIAVIVAEGDINATSEFSDGITPDLIEAQIDRVIDDNDVKAVVLRINSPGGSALASEIIYQKLLALKKKKPVYISISDMAASGGYYMAVAGNKIFANENSVTGSIGVVSMFFNLKDLYEKLGLNYETLELGTNLDFTDLSAKAKTEEIELIKNSMTSIYNEFKQRVATGRKLDLSRVEELAKGQIYTGIEAKNNKLIDEIGGLNDTITSMAKDFKINNYEIVFYQKNFNKLEELLNLKKYVKSSKLLNKFSDFEKQLYFIEEISNKPSLYLPLNFNE